MQCADGIALKHISKCLLGLFHAQPGGRLFRQILSQKAPLKNAGWPVVQEALDATQRSIAS
jgi:tRNA-dihydrouridine synthase A